MKSAGWYFMKGGQRVWAATVAEIRKLAKAAADTAGKPVTVRRAGPARSAPMKRAPMKRNPAGAKRKVTARRNPAIRGVDFTGEEWTVAGMGKRGRLAVIEGSRQDAERMAEYLHGEGYRALTVRRTKAPTSKPTKGAKRPTIDTRPAPKKRRLFR